MNMKHFAIAVCSLLSLGDRALGIVGGAQLATGDIARAVVGIVGPHNSFCTAAAIAHDLLLTAGHCVQPGINYKAQYSDKNGTREFVEVVSFERPPQFNIQVNRVGDSTADIAILALAHPLPATVVVGRLGLHHQPIWPGDRFTVIGEGISIRGLHNTGMNRIALLAATGRPVALQLRLSDPSGKQITMGACSGDSGSPVFQTQGDVATIIAVVSWAGGPNNTKGCGGLTGATPLSPYSQWIEDTISKLSSMPASSE
jgi:hypothetical protein